RRWCGDDGPGDQAARRQLRASWPRRADGGVPGMFSGIVEEVGRVQALERQGESVRLRVAAELVRADLEIGHSIAIDGICLTVTELSPDGFVVGLSPETLRRTSVGGLAPGDRVNLERAVQVGGRIGGHYVQGHVDGVGTILSRRPEGDSEIVTFSAPAELLPYIVLKGYIAVDGISLNVALIEFTKRATGLGAKPVGAAVNLEVDIIGKYVESVLASRFGRAAGLQEDT